MSHTENNLLSNEQILLKPKLHWTVLVRGILTLLPIIYFYSPAKFEYFINYMSINATSIEKVKSMLYNITSLSSHWESFMTMVFLLGGIYFLSIGLYRLITIKMYITNERVIKEVGLISKDTAEVNVDLIDNIEVEQSTLGAFLHYGHVIIYSEAQGNMILPFVKRPGRTKNSIVSIIRKKHGQQPIEA